MSSRTRLFLLALGWLALTAAGCVVIVLNTLNEARAAFGSEAGVMHRLISQQVRQHEALMDTLALLQPTPAVAGGLSAEQRLASVHPAVLRVLRQDEVAAWPEELATLLDAALQRSTAAGRTVAAEWVAGGAGLWLVRSAQPASFAMQFDLRQLAKEAIDSPFAGSSAVAAWLEQPGQPRLMLAGQETAGPPGPWRHQFRQALTARTMTVDLVATRAYDPLDLPWHVLAAWCLATSLMGLGLAAWLQAGAAAVPRSSKRLFVHDDGDDFVPSGWAPRSASTASRDNRRASSGSQPLSVTLRELDAEPPELTVARGAIDQAARESRRSAEMIANLRRTAEQPVVEARLQPLLWDELLRDAFELIEPHCARLGIATTLITDDEAAFVQADPVALEQVINRLLDQAVRCLSLTPESARQLDVTLAAQPEVAVLSVHDTGAHVAGDSVGHAAGQGTNARTQDLRHCEQLLSDMGGRLAVELSEPRGAVVRVSLPRIKG